MIKTATSRSDESRPHDNDNTPKYGMSIIQSDALSALKNIADETYRTCITSPPYYKLRDYRHEEQLGQEATPAEFVAKLVKIFREVRRTLTDDGTLWLNIDDTYGRDGNLLGIPWRLAFALQDDGWFLRQDIIWSKPNARPDPVKDRCVRAHEYIFLLSKNRRYLYDAQALRERGVCTNPGSAASKNTRDTHGTGGGNLGLNNYKAVMKAELAEKGFITRHKRSVWTVNKGGSKGVHCATYPEALVEPCVLACTKPGDRVLDPFGGSGTTGVVATRLGRDCDLIELNPDYAQVAADRLAA